jgi:general secretion pathway protein H
LHSPPSDDYGTAAIRFFPDGSSSGGTISLSGANRDYFIGVDWLTGRVELLENAK